MGNVAKSRGCSVLTKVKVCGITCIDDALAAVDAGADAIGLVFYSASRRYVSVQRATDIVAAVGPFVTTVGLFVNESVEFVERTYQQTGIHIVQLHGDEDAAYCDRMALPYIKAIRMAPGLEPEQVMERYPAARAFLYDTWKADQYGGTGQPFDWHRVSGISARSAILAGGLTVENVTEAVATAAPYAVDVSGGVEVSPGRKDPLLMKKFVSAAIST